MPQVSVLGPLLFIIYINDLPDNIQSTCKIFADDTSLFSHVFDKYKSQSELNNDLQVISNWAFQWEIQMHPDPNKQAQEVYFSKKSNNENSLPVTFNNAKVVTCSTHKHLGLLLDKPLRPHLDYGDIIYDKPRNESFKNKIENIQYKACIAITGASQGTSREHLYQELDWESLGD